MHPAMFDIEKAKKEAAPWPYQYIIDKLIASGFAVISEESTYSWWGKNRVNHLIYKFTPEGKEACFRWMYSTPMSWAEEITKGARHCVVCGRDCYRKKVWAQDGRFRCVCMSCGAKGHGLKDLARNADEYHAAIDIEEAWKARDAHAQKFRYPKPKYLS